MAKSETVAARLSEDAARDGVGRKRASTFTWHDVGDASVGVAWRPHYTTSIDTDTDDVKTRGGHSFADAAAHHPRSPLSLFQRTGVARRGTTTSTGHRARRSTAHCPGIDAARR
jgi:hypothetical protein